MYGGIYDSLIPHFDFGLRLPSVWYEIKIQKSLKCAFLIEGQRRLQFMRYLYCLVKILPPPSPREFLNKANHVQNTRCHTLKQWQMTKKLWIYMYLDLLYLLCGNTMHIIQTKYAKSKGNNRNWIKLQGIQIVTSLTVMWFVPNLPWLHSSVVRATEGRQRAFPFEFYCFLRAKEVVA